MLVCVFSVTSFPIRIQTLLLILNLGKCFESFWQKNRTWVRCVTGIKKVKRIYGEGVRKATFPVRAENQKQLLLIFSGMNNNMQPEKTLVHRGMVHVQWIVINMSHCKDMRKYCSANQKTNVERTEKAKDDLDLEKDFKPELCLYLELGADKIAISACWINFSFETDSHLVGFGKIFPYFINSFLFYHFTISWNEWVSVVLVKGRQPKRANGTTCLWFKGWVSPVQSLALQWKCLMVS